MCDYSLHSLENRLAVEGERLVINKFYTGCKGFVSETDLNQMGKRRSAPAGTNWIKRIAFLFAEMWRLWTAAVVDRRYLPAVCLPHGATLQILGSSAESGQTVRLIQLTHEPFRYRDAVVFSSDKDTGPLSLQKLPEGMVVQVLSLNLAPEEEEERPTVRAIAASSRR